MSNLGPKQTGKSEKGRRLEGSARRALHNVTGDQKGTSQIKKIQVPGVGEEISGRQTMSPNRGKVRQGKKVTRGGKKGRSLS